MNKQQVPQPLSEDDVLRRMLNTPPKPRMKPLAPAKKTKKKTGQ